MLGVVSVRFLFIVDWMWVFFCTHLGVDSNAKVTSQATPLKILRFRIPSTLLVVWTASNGVHIVID